MEDERQGRIFGRNPVREALRSDASVERVYILKGDTGGSIGDIIRMAKTKGVQIKYVPAKWFDETCRGQVHQGVAASITAAKYSELDDLIEAAGKDGLIVLMDSITDPHNLGAIIRSAECFGASGAVIPMNRSAGLTDIAVKASAGAAMYMPVARVTNLSRAIDRLKECGYWIIGADMDGEAYENVFFKGAAAIVIGGEDAGLTRLVREKCDFLAGIPQYGRVSSLNASVAAGILLSEAARQRSRS